MKHLGMAALALLALSCNDHEEGPRSTLTDDQATQMRTACAFTAGTPVGLTVAKDAPIGSEIPIDTVVILMLENRSFDHLLGQLASAGQPDAEGPPADAANPDSRGNLVRRYHMVDQYCFDDTNHEWQGSHIQFNGGKNDGFVITNESGPNGDGTRAMGYYDQTDIPWMYAAANAYAISDRHFASVMGPTFPNREYLYAATSYGHTVNDVFTSGELSNFMAIIETANAQTKSPITWHVYYEGVPGPGIFLDTLTKYLDNVSLAKSFFDDAAAGLLSNVNILDANLRDEWGGGDDYHPPADIQKGEEFVASVVEALTHSPQWPHLALFITFDEHGGLYDHVPPPKACPPDALLPIVPAGETQYDFAQYGFRVPLLVVSPYARPHYVSHRVSDHTSIMRFVEARFRLPAMSGRDANADSLYDLFDFDKPALLQAPSLPTPPIDQAKLQDCETRYPLKPINFYPDMAAPPDMAQ
jgi:phospholipase C